MSDTLQFAQVVAGDARQWLLRERGDQPFQDEWQRLRVERVISRRQHLAAANLERYAYLAHAAGRFESSLAYQGRTPWRRVEEIMLTAALWLAKLPLSPGARSKGRGPAWASTDRRFGMPSMPWETLSAWAGATQA